MFLWADLSLLVPDDLKVEFHPLPTLLFPHHYSGFNEAKNTIKFYSSIPAFPFWTDFLLKGFLKSYPAAVQAVPQIPWTVPDITQQIECFFHVLALCTTKVDLQPEHNIMAREYFLRNGEKMKHFLSLSFHTLSPAVEILWQLLLIQALSIKWQQINDNFNGTL